METSGTWKILKPLGRGGMGEVFLARTPEGTQAALKVLSLGGIGARSVESEARLLSRLKHPALAAVYGVLADSGPIFGSDRGPCYWREYVEGDEILAAAGKADAPTLFSWLVQSLEALAYLHAQGFVHGDLSPRNILIDGSGLLKLLDFGLAASASVGSRLEAATFPYLAPERVDGRFSPASDLFSLGTVFYEAFAGVHPRAACRDFQKMVRFEPKPLGEAAPHLNHEHGLWARTIDRMIEAEPSRRFSRAEEVLEVLRVGRVGRGGRETSSPSPVPSGEYHSALMYGAERPLAAVGQAIKDLPRRSAVICVHGISGVGKTRFLKEMSFECALAGVEPLIHAALESASERDLSALLSLRYGGLADGGSLVVLEWNDDRIPESSRRLLSHLLSWERAIDVPLKNLDRGQTDRMLAAALGPDSKKISEFLFEKTFGNPSMLLQVINLLRGIPAGRWTEDVKKLGSLEDIAKKRLQGLEAADKRILGALAAAGGPVSLDQLLAVVGIPDLRSRLQTLAEREFVSRTDEGLWRPSLPLPPKDAEPFHAAWREALRGDPYPHPQKIRHALALKEQEEVLRGALVTAEFLRDQGRRVEALEMVEAALPLLRDSAEISRLLRLKVNLFNETGAFERALETCETWLALNAADEPESLRKFKYWFITGLIHRNLGRNQEAERRLKKCQAAPEGSEGEHPTGFRVRACTLLGRIAMDEGRTAAARNYLDRALRLAAPKGRQRAEILKNTAILSSSDGPFSEARNLYREDGFVEGEFGVLLQQGLLAVSRGDFEAAESFYQQAEDLARRLKDPFSLAAVWTNQGVLRRQKNDLESALSLIFKAQEILRISGSAKELAENLRQGALTECEIGRFERAEAAARELDGLALQCPEAKSHAAEVRMALRDLREGKHPVPFERLQRIYDKLPPALQVTFAERGDWKGRKAKKAERTMTMEERNAFESLADLNEELLQEEDMSRVLRRLMDAAMKLARAENGFLVLREEDEGKESVAVARNVRKRDLQNKEFTLSLSAVREAFRTGEPVVTDNALQDERFRDAKSVHVRGLKSILALPVRGSSTSGVLGVFYLDHPFEQGLFGEEILVALKAFAGIAALALQKGRMIESLKASNLSLSEEVEGQASRAARMERELRESRLILKNQYSEIIGRSPKMMQVLSLVDRITDSKIPVWIFGESGTGKEAIARALHGNSARAKHPFVSENCSALPESLLESELFGHKKGAFTHATSDKKGLLEYAHQGTVFLDEIADTSLALQAKLLRFLQEGEIRPIGSHQVVKVDVRVVSASNKDLAQLVSDGKFRQDLFFRLNGVTVTLPPLRQRLEDLPLLAGHFLKRIAEREKKAVCRTSEEALKIFLNYSWPGNIRELQNTLETAVLFAEKGVGGAYITPASLHFKPVFFGKSAAAEEALRQTSPSREAGERPSRELEKILITIREQGFHRGNAAKALGMSRRHLYRKLAQYGIAPDSKTLRSYLERWFHDRDEDRTGN